MGVGTYSLSRWVKLNKFGGNLPNLADRIDESPQSTEPKVIVSSKEESIHTLGLKWDHNNGSGLEPGY